jgi:Dolichyl-phosphate-mannose-protein mannosyltransferase
MTTETRPSAALPAIDVPRFALLPVAIIAGVVGLVHLALSFPDGRWFDEELMLAIGRHHLDWGSADQPPLVPLLAALADAVAPDQQWVMRLPAVLATAAAVVVAALIARELGGDARAQTLTALAQATTFWGNLAGHWLAPYTLETVQWLVIGWLVVRWTRVRDDRLLLVLGVVVGIAAETKFQVMGLAVVLLVAVALCGPRELLRRPLLWAGAAVAAAIAAPTLVWQAAHGWPQFAMSSIVAAEAQYLYGGRVGVAVGLVVMAGPMGAFLAVYGTGRLLRDARWRFLGVTAVVLVLAFAAAPGRPYYLDGLYGLLAAAGALGLQRRREAGRTRWRRAAWPATALSAALAVFALVASVQLANPATPERIAIGTAAAYDALPGPLRDRTAIVGGSYIYAAYVDAYSGRLGLPQAYSVNRSYGYFTPPPEDLDAALYVGSDPAELRGSFAAARPVARIGGEGATGLAGEDVGTPVWLLTGRQEPWSRIWLRDRHLDVS